MENEEENMSEDFKQLSEQLDTLSEFCKQHQIAVVAVVHKEGEGLVCQAGSELSIWKAMGMLLIKSKVAQESARATLKAIDTVCAEPKRSFFHWPWNKNK